MTARLPFVLSVPLTLAAPLGAHAMPMDDSQVSIGSRGDGEVIVINDCRPGSIRWNIDGEVHCVGIGAMPSAPPPSHGPTDPGDSGCRAPRMATGARCGGGGTRRPNRREQCIKEARKWGETCTAQAIAFLKQCRSVTYDIAIGYCTGQGAVGADNRPRRPCTEPVRETIWDPVEQSFRVNELPLNDMGKPVYWDPVHNVACDDRRGCAGSWLYERPEATVSSGSSSSWGTNSSVQIGVPGFSTGLGGNEGGGESMTIEVKYDPRLGGYQSCGVGAGRWRDACSAKSAEMEAKCLR
jgi:hypothetical protein